MIYYLDCEFDGYGGPLISIGIAAWDHRTFYAVLEGYYIENGKETVVRTECDEWVYDNVLPVLWPPTCFAYQPSDGSDPIPVPGSYAFKNISRTSLSEALEAFFHNDMEIHIIADWPDDLKYFCELLITGPGRMINIPNLALGVARVDAYPTRIPDAIQHNAMWDAIALAEHLQPGYYTREAL